MTCIVGLLESGKVYIGADSGIFRGDYALGSMATSSGSPESRITRALKVAARFSAGVRAPFFIKSL